METQEIVVQPTNTETSLSPIVLDRWQESLTEMDKHEAQAIALHEKAKAIEVKDADSFAQAGQLVAELKHVTAASEACMEPYKLKVRKVLDFIQQRFNKNKNRAGEGHAILSVKMGNYSRAEREAAAKEQKELNKKLERKGEDPVTVQPNLPKVAGVRNTVNYPITIEDPKALIKACLKAYKATDTKRFQFLAQFIKLDESALAAHARELKDAEQFNKEIPGVKCERKEAFGGKV